MSPARAKAIEVAKRDLDDLRAIVRRCEHDLSRAKEAARAADQRLKELQGKPVKAAS